MDHYADDLAALTEHLDLRPPVHVGHSTGGGEVAHYIARHGESRVAKAVAHQCSASHHGQDRRQSAVVCPSRFSTTCKRQVATNRAQFYLDLPPAPSTASTVKGAKVSQGIIRNWWRQGMMGGVKAHYDGIVAFSQTDFTPDLKKISVPTLVMHGDDDQIVPYADSGPLSAQAAAERHAEDLSRIPPRHADDAGRHHQCRPADLHRVLIND